MSRNEHNKPVVNVVQDSETDLQALFDSVLKPGPDSKRPLQVPWSMRKLPESFFNPPPTGSKSINHSRENSVDSVLGSPNSGENTTTANLRNQHHRAHSSPASLQETCAIGQQSTPPHHHLKQRSYDMSSKFDDVTPLPTGWEQARTPEGQVYYLNHTTRTTTWEDPRKLAQAASEKHQSIIKPLPSPHQIMQIPPMGQNITSVAETSDENALGPLPEGWEQAQTSEEEIYFINHQSRTTSWLDPRIFHLYQETCPKSNAVQYSLQTPNLPQSSQVKQQRVRLQLLQLERERLKQRQQEIRRQQELMLLRHSNTELPIISTPNEHFRQESADSGLGMGRTYSISQTHPEDFLESMDDSTECNTMETSDSLSLGGSIDASTINLVPSLQLDEEILDDVEGFINAPL